MYIWSIMQLKSSSIQHIINLIRIIRFHLMFVKLRPTVVSVCMSSTDRWRQDVTIAVIIDRQRSLKPDVFIICVRDVMRREIDFLQFYDRLNFV